MDQKEAEIKASQEQLQLLIDCRAMAAFARSEVFKDNRAESIGIMFTMAHEMIAQISNKSAKKNKNKSPLKKNSAGPAGASPSSSGGGSARRQTRVDDDSDDA